MKFTYTEKYILNFSQLIFRLGLFAIIEFVKHHFGQNFLRTFHYLIFFCVFLLATSIEKDGVNKFRNSVFSFLIILDIAEAFSWYFMISAINYQAINAIDFDYIVNDHREFLFVIIFALVFVVIFNFLPFYTVKVELPRIFDISKFFAHVLTFTFVLSIIHDFVGNRKVLKSSNNVKYISYLKKSLSDKLNVFPQVLDYDEKSLKNLILLQLESYPYEAVNKDVSPYLYSLSQRYEYVAPIRSQPYTTWTTAGIAVTQCGIPQILPTVEWKIRRFSEIKYLTGIKCIPDILGSFGYKRLFGLTGGEYTMGLSHWRTEKGYELVNQSKNDFQLFSYFSDFLDKMDKDARSSDSVNKSRYLLFLNPEDTHLPYRVPSWCKLENSKLNTTNDRCYHCFDSLVKSFINKFLELRMQEHTVLVVFPDHLPHGPNIKKKYTRLFILFPGIDKIDPKFRTSEEITYYDFAPTLLDMIGIKKYVPEFTFGRNIYKFDNSVSDDSHINHYKPDENDLIVINNFLNNGNRNNWTRKNKFKCYIGTTCKYYYSSVPCESTYQ